MNKKTKTFVLFLVILALFVGGVYYFGYQPQQTGTDCYDEVSATGSREGSIFSNGWGEFTNEDDQVQYETCLQKNGVNYSELRRNAIGY